MNLMIKQFFLLYFLVCGFKSLGQSCETQLITTNQFSGISLGPSCGFLQEFKGQFQPTLEQINEAEQGMNDQLYERMIEHAQIESRFAIKNPMRHYRKWKRQYFGDVNDLGQQIIKINLLNFGARNAKTKFVGWEKHFIFGFGKFYEKNTRSYTYNLTTGRLKI